MNGNGERGVSDLLGFVLMFGILITSITLVMTLGFTQLTDVQESEELKSSRSGMLELAESFEYIKQQTAITRRAGLSLRSESVQFKKSGLAVHVNDTDSTTPNTTIQTQPWALMYETGENTIVYEGGGLFFLPAESTVGIVDKKPSVSCNPDRGIAIVSLLVFDTDELYYSSGASRDQLPSGDAAGDTIEVTGANAVPDDGSVIFTARHNNTTVTRKNVDGDDVVIDISDTASQAGWERLEQQTEWTKSGTELRCNDVTHVLIRTTEVSLEISW